MIESQLRPDFVIVGTPHAKGVVVLASTELSQVELNYEARDICLDEFPVYTLLTTMRRFVMVTGATYPEAFEKLFHEWSPDRRSIGTAHLGIERGH